MYILLGTDYDMYNITNTEKLNSKAQENLRRNEFLRRRELGPIPPLNQSTLAIFDPERIEPLREEVNGKIVLKFRYIVYAPPMYEYGKGEHEVTVDAKTSAHIDEYLGNGITMLEIKVSRRRNDVRYKIEPPDMQVCSNTTQNHVLEKQEN